MTRHSQLWVAATLAGALAACSTGAGPNPNGGQVTFSVATQGTAPAAAALMAAVPETLGVGNDTIVFDKVELVLRQIEFKRVEATAACPSDGPGSDHQSALHDDGPDDHADDCEEMKTGPVLLDLPLGTGAARQFSVAIDTGTYGEVKFKLHKPSDDAGDPEFIAANPDFDGISVRATGTFNGTAFVFTSDASANQEVNLLPPLTVSDATPVSLTLFVDLSTWFRSPGGALIDPAEALSGQPFENEVSDNIKASFRAFEDDDHDGHDDHGNDGGNHD